MVENNLNIQESFIAVENFNELSPYLSHFFFFSEAVILQSNQNQIEEWQPKFNNLEIFGCYAQTELGHGSNVRGLEIEATYDHANKQFILNSPTEGACKWWIGALGKTANHALLIAQLKINGNSYGPHAFLVPVRDSITHEPFEGVDVGDIGPKIGLHTADNGYLKFDNYRIDKKYMLSRFVKINDNGDYEVLDPNSLKLLYLSLMHARVMIISDAWFCLAAALTISIRYSFSRKQFSDVDKPNTENQILDYQIQQYKLFKPLSLMYAYTFARVALVDMFERAKKETESDSTLAFVHCMLCLYKVFLSDSSLTAIEQCRRSCGGHGYMMISGLPTFYTTFLPKVTYDGDNSILALQAIKYLISLYKKQPPSLFAYIYSTKIIPDGHHLSADFHHQCLKAVAQYKMFKVYSKSQVLINKYKKEKIWNDYLQVEGIDAAESVYVVTVHHYFSEAVNKMENSINKEAVEKLRFLYAADHIVKYEGILIGLGVNSEKLDLIKREMIETLKFIKKHALGLVEAYELNDESLNSIIGRKDGDFYRHMLSEAKNGNPINQGRLLPQVKELLRPKL